LFACAAPAVALSVSKAVQVIRPDEFKVADGVDHQPDGPIVTYRELGKQRWLLSFWNKTHGGIDQVVSAGNTDEPLSKIIGVEPQRSFFNYDNTLFSGNFWVVNTYQANTGILAFIHVENAEGSEKHLDGGHTTGKTRIGIAWSSDEGRSFRYLGHIIVPFGDTDSFNIQGLPYLVKEGFFYIYFHDSTGFTVARAPVAEVLTAAQQGQVSSWMKYNGPEMGFSSSGLGGPSKKLGVDGISHSDAACSTVTDKCYLILTRMNWGGQDTWVRLFESTDGLNWTMIRNVAQQPAAAVKGGYQFATIVNEDGKDNGNVGRHFYLYVYKDHQNTSRTMLRWLINLDP
jgi:hypothetical protein